jgi:hypothetical protein
MKVQTPNDILIIVSTYLNNFENLIFELVYRINSSNKKIHQKEITTISQLEWIISNYKSFELDIVLFNAILENGNLDVIIWLKNNGCKFDHRIVYSFGVLSGNVKLVEWLRQYGDICDEGWNSNLCYYAAMKGDINMLKWLRSPDRNPSCPWNKEVTAIAAQYNHLETLQWLVTPDIDGVYCPIDRTTYLSAIDSNNIEIIKWLTKNLTICPYDEYIALYALITDKNDIFKWLVGKEYSGLPYNKTICAHYANSELREWIENQND